MPNEFSVSGPNGRKVRVEVLCYEQRDSGTGSDANWLQCGLNVEAGGFSVTVYSSLTTHDLGRFLEQLGAVLSSTEPSASLCTDEDIIRIAVASDQAGRVTVTGYLRDPDVRDTELRFSFDSDLSYLTSTRDELSLVTSEFPIM